MNLYQDIQQKSFETYRQEAILRFEHPPDSRIRLAAWCPSAFQAGWSRFARLTSLTNLLALLASINWLYHSAIRLSCLHLFIQVRSGAGAALSLPLSGLGVNFYQWHCQPCVFWGAGFSCDLLRKEDRPAGLVGVGPSDGNCTCVSNTLSSGNGHAFSLNAEADVCVRSSCIFSAHFTPVVRINLSLGQGHTAAS